MTRTLGRVRLAYQWIPKNTNKLLDAGCASGEGTNLFSQKAKDTVGIDISEKLLNVAKENYPSITFKKRLIEKTDFTKDTFDVIILNDILEHTQNEIDTLNEMFRILKPNGTIIITTPHKGLFSFLDVDNYTYYAKKFFPRVYEKIFKIRTGKKPEQRTGYTNKHHHYSKKNFIKFLNDSSFKKSYQIEKVFRSGFLIGPLVNNINFILEVFIGRKIARKTTNILNIFKNLEYQIPFWILSYNIAIKIKKTK